MDINQLVPISELTQGDDWSFLVDIPDYDASTTTLQYYFKSATVIPFFIASTNSAGSFSFSVPAATTSTFTPGGYQLIVILLDNITATKTTLALSTFTILPDLTKAVVSDPRTPNQIALSQIEALLLASVASGDVGLSDYTIGGTTVRTDKAGLLNLRSHYLKLVRREQGQRAINYILPNL